MIIRTRAYIVQESLQTNAKTMPNSESAQLNQVQPIDLTRDEKASNRDEREISGYFYFCSFLLTFDEEGDRDRERKKEFKYSVEDHLNVFTNEPLS